VRRAVNLDRLAPDFDFVFSKKSMAEVNHRYIGRIPSEGEQERQTKRDQLDAEWKRKRIDAESARQRLHEAKMLAMKGELISKKHVTRQAAFLVISLRQRLLAIAAQHARELLNVSDEREMASRLDAIVRSALDEIAELPERVSDPNWMQRLDEHEAASSKRPRRAGISIAGPLSNSIQNPESDPIE
jgi:hypothetical protein